MYIYNYTTLSYSYDTLFNFNQAFVDAFLVDVAHTVCGDLEVNPLVQFGDVELFGMQVGVEFPFRADIGVGDIVAHNRFLPCNFANS